METKKKHSIHFWIKQLRHILCMSAVLIVVFIYCSNASAYSEDSESLSTRYNYTFQNSQNLYILNMLPQAQAKGIDTTKLSYNVANRLNYAYSIFCNGDIGGNESTITSGLNNLNVLNGITINSVQYDLSSAYVVVCSERTTVSFSTALITYVVPSDSKVVVCDGYFVSKSPFVRIAYDQLNRPYVTQVTTASANGYYCAAVIVKDAFQTSYRFPCMFTDCDLYFLSSDGSTGHTNFSTTSTDFDIDDSNNFNFNFLKTGGSIVAPGDPVDTGGNYIDYAKSKMNFSMTSYYTGGKLLNNAKHDVSIIWPEVVKQNPENFYVVCDYTGRYKDDALASTITFERQVLHGTTEKWIPVTEIMSRSGGKLPSSFDIDVGLNTLVDGNGKSMYRYFLESVSAFSGASVNSVENNSLWYQFLVDVGEAVSNWLGISEEEQPLAKLAQDIDSYIDVMEIDGYVWIAYSDSSDTYSTGKNHTTFNFKTGDSSTVGTDNTINQYPEEGQDIYNVPSVAGGGTTSNYNQNAPVAYGGQVVLENNIQALVEYLFHIDTDDLLAMQGNISSTFNTVIGQITDTSDNGFLPLLERTYSYIPEEIWSWIKTAVGAVLLIAVWQAFISNKRIKG